MYARDPAKASSCPFFSSSFSDVFSTNTVSCSLLAGSSLETKRRASQQAERKTARVAPTAAPEPDQELLERARRAVEIRLREKRVKDEAYRREHGRERPQALREAGSFAGWYLRHLLATPSEVDEVLERERLREIDKLERERLRAEAPKKAAPSPSDPAELYRATLERAERKRWEERHRQ